MSTAPTSTAPTSTTPATTAAVPTTAMEQPQAVALENARVRLEPLGPQHVEGLQAVVADGKIWRIPYAPHVPAPDQVADRVGAQCGSDESSCLGVEFRVHHLNIASRRAVERLGAQQDGILRAHRIMPDGTIRHTIVYSILADEWTGVKASLEHRLRR